MGERQVKWGIRTVLAVYCLLGLAYSIVNPIFESPDEALHYAQIRTFVEEQRLGRMQQGERNKAHHPPLYYAIGALATFWVPNQHFDALAARINPFIVTDRLDPGVDNKSLYLHGSPLEAFPYRDAALGVHLVRWLSLLMGAGTIWLVFQTARELFPEREALALGSAVLVAFNPMFIFITASVHDDALAYLMSAAVLYVTVRGLRHGASRRRAVALGVLIGASVLTKLTCLTVLPAVGAALLWRTWRDHGRDGWRELLRRGGIIAALTSLIGGWWLVRNYVLYGEPTSMVRQAQVWGVRDNAPDVAAAFRELGFFHDSAWGLFGYGQIPMPGWVAWITRSLSLIALLGCLRFVLRRRRDEAAHAVPLIVWGILALAPLATFGANFARMTVSTAANFGRYMFAALGVLAPLYALGLAEHLPRRGRRWLPWGLGVGLGALAVFALLGVIRPAYAWPAPLTDAQVDAVPNPVRANFGDALVLLGYAVDAEAVRPGESVMVSLYWEASAPTDRDYAAFLHLLGDGDLMAAQRDTYPGLGRIATTALPAGYRWVDHCDVRIPETAYAPEDLEIRVGLYDVRDGARLPVVDAGTVETVVAESLTLGEVRLQPHPGDVPNPIEVVFGRRMALQGYRLARRQVRPGETLDLTLFWSARRDMDANYTVSVQLLDDKARKAAQHDAWPAAGAAPTGAWTVGERVTDAHPLEIHADAAPGVYEIQLVVYAQGDNGLENLRVTSDEGQLRPDRITLTHVRVGE